MRNKNKWKYAAFLAVIIPFLAFSVVFAEHGEEEETQEVKPTPIQRPSSSVQQRANLDNTDKVQRSGESADDRESKDSALAKRKVMVAGLVRMMGNQINRAEKAIARLDQIMERIQSRRDKLAEKEGVDLTKVDALIVTAEKQKVEAQEAIRKAKAAWETFQAASDNDGDPRAAGKAFMESMRDVNKKLIAFHKTLHEIVQAMKRAEPKPEGQTKCDNLSSQEASGCRSTLKENN